MTNQHHIDKLLSYRYNTIKRFIMEKYPHRVIVRLSTAQKKHLEKSATVSKAVRKLIDDDRNIPKDK